MWITGSLTTSYYHGLTLMRLCVNKKCNYDYKNIVWFKLVAFWSTKYWLDYKNIKYLFHYIVKIALLLWSEIYDGLYSSEY